MASILGKRKVMDWRNESAAKRTKNSEEQDGGVEAEDGNGYDDVLETLPVTMENILAAAKRIEGGVVETTCHRSRGLSAEFGMNVFLKNDFRQFTGSFKERGALNALLQLSAAKRKKGVIAASAGNHALALAYHGQRLKTPVTVVMPFTAPLTKIKQCRDLGANVIVDGDTFSDAVARAQELCAERGLTYVHGFNDKPVIAGQGSVGLEIMRQVPDVDAIIVPVGGGGLIAGIAIAVKSEMPHVQVIGVESSTFPCMGESLIAGQAVEVPGSASIADGLAVRKPGENNVAICAALVDRVITVEEHYIALAILRLMEGEKSVVEGAGATGIAPLLSGQLPELKGKNVAVVLCGGNIDVTLLGRVLDHGLATDYRLIRFKCIVQDRPGGLANLTKVLADAGASVKELWHDRVLTGDQFSCVTVTVTVHTRDREHWDRVYAALMRENIPVKFESFDDAPKFQTHER